MTEKEFHSLLLEMVKRGSHPQKSKIIELLERSTLSCNKTSEFTRRKWNHYKEYVYFSFEPGDLPEALQYKDYISKLVDQIYPVNDDYEYELFGVEFKPGRVSSSELASQEIFFDDIQDQILEEIRNAKYTIWVAMAWFTNPILYAALVESKKRGVNVQVVVDDNDKNANAPFRLEDEFETYRINIQSYYRNFMHDKFCVVDLATVIHGTFNWTNAANYNRETISVDKNSATAKVFADEFIKLKTRVYG